MGDSMHTKFNIFFGSCFGSSSIRADEKINDWIDHEKELGKWINIIRWQYQQARYGEHSICIEYEEYEYGRNE